MCGKPVGTPGRAWLKINEGGNVVVLASGG